METEQIDIFAALEEEAPSMPYPEDGELFEQFLNLQGYIMAPPVDATADMVAQADQSYTTIQTELIARGLIVPEPSNGNGHNGSEDRMRACTKDDYERLRDALISAGQYPDIAEAEFGLNQMLGKFKCDKHGMTWSAYNAVQKQVAELCYAARQKAGEKKPKPASKKRGSGTAKNADKTTQPATSPPPATASEEVSPEPIATDSRTEADHDHNEFAFIEKLDEWVAYEDVVGADIPAENIPTTCEYQALFHFCEKHHGISKADFDQLLEKDGAANFTWRYLRDCLLLSEKRLTEANIKAQQGTTNASGLKVNEDGEVLNLSAALRIIGVPELPPPGTPEALAVVDRILEIMKGWRHKIDDLKQQHERKLKKPQERIAWFESEFGAYRDADARARITLHNTKKGGNITPKYWDYDHARVSFGVTGGAEVFHEGYYHQFIEKLVGDRARFEDGMMDAEEATAFQKTLTEFADIFATIKIETVVKADKKAIEKLVEEKGLQIPGWKVNKIEPLGSKAKVS